MIIKPGGYISFHFDVCHRSESYKNEQFRNATFKELNIITDQYS